MKIYVINQELQLKYILQSMSKYAYTHADHFRYTISKHNDPDKNIPDDVLQKITNYLTETELDISFENIKKAIRDLRIDRYFEDLPSICKKMLPSKEPQCKDIVVNEKYKCPVCLCQHDDVTELKCKHMLCHDCFNMIKENEIIKCPLCRQISLSTKEIFTKLSKDQIDNLMLLFKKAHNAFTQLNLKRQCMLPFEIVLHNLCQICNYQIPPHLNYQNKTHYDGQWMKICEINNWVYM